MVSRNSVVPACLILFLLFATTSAQQKTESSPSDFVLEIVFVPGVPPAYQNVPRSESTPGRAWYARFNQVKGWQLPPGADPVRAVNIVHFFRGETATINVSVMRGKKFHDVEEMVATNELAENQTWQVEALKNFGVEPFVIRLVRVGSTLAEPPAIRNLTKSIEVVGIEPVISTLPRFKLTLHNVSAKDIAAVKLEVRQGQKLLMETTPGGIDGTPFVRGGESVEVGVSPEVRAEPAAGNYKPTVPVGQELLIKGLIFTDGSFEGDNESAAVHESWQLGCRIELRRIVPLLTNAASPGESVSTFAPANLRSQLEALNFEVADTDLGGLRARFPARNQDSLKSWVEGAMHSTRKDLLDELKRFQTSSDIARFRSWLIAAEERYSNWLARLDEKNSTR
ncbi:MAG TPA: hypothetical protein VGW76_02315 [Pyrinomonadaceae bacterium]|nr:hypothetical protein [Pyrinomonadaceae bacterium]